MSVSELGTLSRDHDEAGVRVGDIMRTDVVTVAPRVPVPEAIQLILARGVSELVVVDQDRRVVGVVTEPDILAWCVFHPASEQLGGINAFASTWRNRWWRKAAGTTVEMLMTAPALTTTPDASIESAAARMVTLSLRRLPVVDEAGRLVGLVSQRDLLRALADGQDPVGDDGDAT
jgi:CBS domain-containing protein